MTEATTPIRIYSVLYAVTRSEYYEIEAASPEEAEDRGFEEGELTRDGDTTNVVACGVEQIKRRAPKNRARGMKNKLPPDPENMNGGRAEWAAAALRHFQCTTGTDYDDALTDLLCDLMHWCNRNKFDFEATLDRAGRITKPRPRPKQPARRAEP